MSAIESTNGIFGIREGSEVLFTTRRDRAIFIAKVYAASLICIAFTCFQVMSVLMIDSSRKAIVQQRFLLYSILILLIITLLLFMNFRDLRMTFPCNIAMLLLMIEAASFALMVMLMPYHLQDIGIAFAAANLITIFTSLLGYYLPIDLTKRVSLLILWVGTVLVGCFVIIVWSLFYKSPIYVIVFCTFAVASVALLLLYHSQAMFGGRLAEVRTDEYLLSACIVYVDFFCIFVLFLSGFKPTLDKYI